MDGQWKLIPIAFKEDWSVEQCREIAADVASHMGKDQTAIGAFDEQELVGFITVSHEIFGSTAKYVELVCFEVSKPYRGKKIGKTLFYEACEEAKRSGQISCIFRHILPGKARQHIRRLAAFMQRRLTGKSQKKSHAMCSWNMILTENNWRGI